MASILLPAIFTICASLGIAKSDCTEYAFMNPSGAQTDQSLWYAGSASYPNDAGRPSDCFEAVPIATYDIYDGSKGTSYACKEKPADDTISPDELKSLTAYVARLNSITPKTLDDHRAAMKLKWLIKSISGSAR